MKRKLTFLAAAAFTLMALIVPASTPATASQVSAVDQARQVGQSFIAQKTLVFPEWQGASLGSAQTYDDLQGQVDAYLFPIQKAGQAIGRIVVGSAAYNYDVLEAGGAPPPVLPSSDELRTSVSKDLGIATPPAGLRPVRLAYLGYNSYAAIYNVAGRSVAFDLRYRRAAAASGLKMHVSSPHSSQNTANGVQSPLTLQWANLPVPIETQGVDGKTNDCGPTSGAMIAEYYKNSRGDTGFLGWPYDHDELYDKMSTNNPSWPGGTYPSNVVPGFVSYAAECSYSFSGYWHPTAPWDYTTIENCINVQQPDMILFLGTAPYAQWHYCAITGYWIDDTGSWVIINNPHGYSDMFSWTANYSFTYLFLIQPN